VKWKDYPMRTLARAIPPTLLLAAAITAATPAHAATSAIPIAGYDVQQTPPSGFGGWTHDYTGTKVPTGRFIPPTGPGGTEPELLNDTGGSGSLNDGLVTNSAAGTQLFTNRPATDGQPVAPVLTLHLAQAASVAEIRLIGGDVPFNILPGTIDSLTVTIAGRSLSVHTTDAGTTDIVSLSGTPLADLPTDRVVLSSIVSSFPGISLDQFVLGEVQITGTPTAQAVEIDVAPGTARNLITGRTVAVAVLSSATFDAFTAVNPSSLTFGKTGDEASRIFCPFRRAIDVNGDRRPDLVCEFAVRPTGLIPGDTTATLKGSTTSGTPIVGTDTIRVLR
jgi:hypothetical protein